jgi:adenylosuccinate lyase
MNLTELSAISPIDGRYRSKTSSLAPFFSEYALIKYRVRIEIEYFIELCETGVKPLHPLDQKTKEDLKAIYQNFSEKDAQSIKDIERVTNHDVKAVEYFIKNQFDRLGLDNIKEFVHFGLTSQDINNTAIPLSLKEAHLEVVLPMLQQLVKEIEKLAESLSNIPMLARTHGQPASPTRLGKEFKVFTVRLHEQISQFESQKFSAKFGGATGNYNAHKVAYPSINWPEFGRAFVTDNLGLHFSYPTTQIEHYDHLAGLFDLYKRINTILIDLSRDVWSYISMDYFKQRIKEGEVGSSAMPHKVNPIDFENAEGNLGLANAIYEHLSAKLPISRLQRDLTDSTVLRNVGVPIGHSILAMQSLLKGFGKLLANKEKVVNELSDNWAVVAEAIQTILRREQYPNPYESLKALTRTHSVMNEKAIHDFIETLNVSDSVKSELKAIRPENYLGF